MQNKRTTTDKINNNQYISNAQQSKYAILHYTVLYTERTSFSEKTITNTDQKTSDRLLYNFYYMSV